MPTPGWYNCTTECTWRGKYYALGLHPIGSDTPPAAYFTEATAAEAAAKRTRIPGGEVDMAGRVYLADGTISYNPKADAATYDQYGADVRIAGIGSAKDFAAVRDQIFFLMFQGDVGNAPGVPGMTFNSFADTLGIDNARSSSHLHDGAGGYWHPDFASPTYTEDQMQYHTWDAVARVVYYGHPNDALDGDTSTGWSTAGYDFSWWMAKQTGDAQAFLPGKARIYQAIGRIQGVEIKGSNLPNPSPDVAGDWTVLGTKTLTATDNAWQEIPLASGGVPYRHYFVNITQPTHAVYPGFEEFQILGVADATMFIESEQAAALNAPTVARACLFLEDVNPITINTDVIMYVSVNDGTTWFPVPLSAVGAVGAIIQYAASIDLTMENTHMRWRIETFNSKDFKLHAAGMSWRQV